MTSLLDDDTPATPAPGTPAPGTPPAPAPAPGTPPAPGAPPATPSPGDALAPDKTAEFLKQFPEDLQKSPSLARYTSTESLARAYLNAERLLGSEKIPIPKDDGDQEAWDRYYKAGGRPDEPTQYEFQKPDKLPPGVTYDDNMETWWKQSAYEAGLSKKQAGKLYDQYRDRFFAQAETGERSAGEQVTQAKVVLQRDWGNEYQARRALAKAAFAEMPEDLQKAAASSGLVRMPSFVKYLYSVKAAVSGEADPHEGGRGGGADTPDALRTKIAEHRKTHEKALGDVTHPEHDMRLRELSDMHNKLFQTPEAA